MFSVKAKRGIASSFLPSEQIANIEAEEQLEELFNTSEKKLSGGHTENHIPKKNIEEDLQSTASSHQVLAEKHELISIKRATAKENILLQATRMLRISQNNFLLLKMVALYEYKSLMSTMVVQIPEMC